MVKTPLTLGICHPWNNPLDKLAQSIVLTGESRWQMTHKEETNLTTGNIHDEKTSHQK